MNVLDKIKQGSDSLPPRLLLATPEGIGKTTFASQSPNPLFLSAENGMTGFEHFPHFSLPFDEILVLLDELTKAITYKTIVVDTSDWLERSIHQFICQRDKKSDIEDYRYGKGYKVAEVELVKMLTKLDQIRSKHKIGIIILSHVHIKAFTSPTGETWDRYEMKGHKAFTGILREWVDACLFGIHEVFKTKEKGERNEKVIGGDRVLHTIWSPAWDAKNRYNLPETLPFLEGSAYADLFKAIEDNSTSKMRERFKELIKSADLSEDDRKKWEGLKIETFTADKLREGITRLETKQPKK